jgi:hypothetical protein
VAAKVAGIRRWRPRRCLTVVAVGVIVTLLAPFVVVAIALRIAYMGDPDPPARTHGRDAVWLGHAWVDGRRGAADVMALARRVRGTGVRDLYVHTRSAADDPARQRARAVGGPGLVRVDGGCEDPGDVLGFHQGACRWSPCSGVSCPFPIDAGSAGW